MCKTKKMHKVRAMNTATLEEHSDSYDDFAFTVTDSADNGTLTVLINNLPVKMLIDSGASCNIVTRSTFEQLKSKLKHPEKEVYPFGSKAPVHVRLIFTAASKHMKRWSLSLQKFK